MILRGSENRRRMFSFHFPFFFLETAGLTWVLLVLIRFDWMIYRGPVSLAVLWFVSQPTPFPLLSQEDWERETTWWGGGEGGGDGRGAKSHDRKKASSSFINQYSLVLILKGVIPDDLAPPTYLILMHVAKHRVAPGDAARSEQGIAAICSKK